MNSVEPPSGPPPVGAKLESFRKRQKLTLDQLSQRAGVSKSMLSQIERNTANPTVAILWRLANALGIELTDFLSDERGSESVPVIKVTEPHAIPSLRTPDGKCVLRIMGPVELAGKFEWYQVVLEPGGMISSEPHEQGTREHLTVLSGTLEVTCEGVSQKLRSGQTARYAVDVPHSIKNPVKSIATGILVVEHRF